MAHTRTRPTLALVVEDDPETRALETDVLKAGGFNVLQARNGEDALRLAQERRPGVVLLDIALPTSSGFDVLCTLKSRPATARSRSSWSAHTPVLSRIASTAAPTHACRSRLTSTSCWRTYVASSARTHGTGTLAWVALCATTKMRLRALIRFRPLCSRAQLRYAHGREPRIPQPQSRLASAAFSPHVERGPNLLDVALERARIWRKRPPRAGAQLNRTAHARSNENSTHVLNPSGSCARTMSSWQYSHTTSRIR